ncbi:hypothetical protein [Paraburkholderia pallida]|uniref:Uncharacterized protein n=1 Tax=Paraburkholderia pallida TaxID=2547399 RepID=A0A4P7D3A8_9BURK|nr:hypothetical protein [Paraburkholderia pallida]QBR03186.1 hypothetical protein E1956_39175 [Paraburkholderia pallida]
MFGPRIGEISKLDTNRTRFQRAVFLFVDDAKSTRRRRVKMANNVATNAPKPAGGTPWRAVWDN